MNDDQLLLASAYLDGDVDDAARARAEADVEVMAQVARMRTVREELRTVEAPDPDRRERAVSVALATPADEPAPVRAPPPPPPPPTRLPQRSRRAAWGGVVAAAAALVLVAAASIVLRGTNGGDDDDDASVATVQTLDDAAPSAADQETDAARTNEAFPSAGDDPDDGAGSAPEATAGTEATASGAPRTQVADAPPELRTSADLAAFATSRAAAQDQGAAPACTSPGTFLGPVIFAGALAEVFEVGTVVTALDAATCEVLATVER